MLRKRFLAVCCVVLMHAGMVEAKEMPVPGSSMMTVTVELSRDVMGTFMVDTGSTYTAITPQVARMLGITISSDTPRVQIRTMQGQVRVPKVVIPQLRLQNKTYTNVEAIVTDLNRVDDGTLAGIIGLNVLSKMKLNWM